MIKRQFRHMLLFMLFPDEFGRMFSAGDRKSITRKFSNLETGDIKKMSALEIDQEISKISKRLKHEHGVERVDWYSSPFREMWKGKAEEAAIGGLVSSSQKNVEDYSGKKREARNIIYYGPPGTGKTLQDESTAS